MNFKYIYKTVIALACMSMLFTSCLDELNQVPEDDRQTSEALYNSDPWAAYQGTIAKAYASFILTGQSGPAGNSDITADDEGFTSYIRQYFQIQELPTDEAVNAWSDPGTDDLNTAKWSVSNASVQMMYDRIFFAVSICNEFLREATDSKIDSRDLTDTQKAEVRTYRTEARFLRALAYSHAIDIYGNVPFVTEDDPVGFFLPNQSTRTELFDFVVSELLAIEDSAREPRSVYARADKAAVWMLLSKLYLNAEVYTGTAKYTECLTYCNKVLSAGYSLEDDYSHNFLADNHTSSEIIFPLVQDGITSQTWGGTTYIIRAAIGGSMDAAEFGVSGGWGGNRSTSTLTSKFPNVDGSTDKRAIFHTDGQEETIADMSQFTQGFGVAKFKNVTSAGDPGSDSSLEMVDTDYPLFRLADIYLMYAESVLRGGNGGSAGQALSYMNNLRERAYGNTDGNINAGDLTLDFILDERARELYWESHRRQDLIRFNKFTGNDYTWSWKGGSMNGQEIPAYKALLPIPASDMNANPNLVQNTGY